MTTKLQRRWTWFWWVAGVVIVTALIAGFLKFRLALYGFPINYSVRFEMTTVLEVDGKQVSASSVVEEGWYDTCPNNYSHMKGLYIGCRWGHIDRGVGIVFDLGDRGFVVVPLIVGVPELFGHYKHRNWEIFMKSSPDLSRPRAVPHKSLLFVSPEAVLDINNKAKLHRPRTGATIAPGVVYISTSIVQTRKPLVRKLEMVPTWLSAIEHAGSFELDKTTLDLTPRIGLPPDEAQQHVISGIQSKLYGSLPRNSIQR